MAPDRRALRMMTASNLKCLKFGPAMCRSLGLTEDKVGRLGASRRVGQCRGIVNQWLTLILSRLFPAAGVARRDFSLNLGFRGLQRVQEIRELSHDGHEIKNDGHELEKNNPKIWRRDHASLNAALSARDKWTAKRTFPP